MMLLCNAINQGTPVGFVDQVLAETQSYAKPAIIRSIINVQTLESSEKTQLLYVRNVVVR